MELMLIFRVLARRWWLIAIPVVITAAFTVPELLTRSPATSGGYTVTLRYSAAHAADAVLPPRDGDYQDLWLASELTVNALTDWVRSGSFAREVAIRCADLGLTIDPAGLSVAADNERSLGQLILGWNDAAQLGVIARAAIDVLQTRSQDYFPQLGGQAAQVMMLDTPQVVAAPPALVNRFAPLLRVGLGLALGLALAFLAEYLDTRLYRRADVEALNLGVIGIIPRR